jgi:GNAT superfamily N-acetyltransferase
MATIRIVDPAKEREAIKKVFYGCGSRNVKKSYAYLRTLEWLGKEKLIVATVEDYACVVLYRGVKSMRVIDLAILPEQQRKGLGSSMMQWVVTKARNEGKERITLRTDPEEGAFPFLTKMGFVPVRPNGETDVEMELVL